MDFFQILSSLYWNEYPMTVTFTLTLGTYSWVHVRLWLHWDSNCDHLVFRQPLQTKGQPNSSGLFDAFSLLTENQDGKQMISFLVLIMHVSDLGYR